MSKLRKFLFKDSIYNVIKANMERTNPTSLTTLRGMATRTSVSSMTRSATTATNLTEGEIRLGNGLPPGGGFSGLRIGYYPPVIYNGEEWVLAGVFNDVLQAGLKYSDGKIYAGGGYVTLDAAGIHLLMDDSPLGENTIEWEDGSGGKLVLQAYNDVSGSRDAARLLSGRDANGDTNSVRSSLLMGAWGTGGPHNAYITFNAELLASFALGIDGASVMICTSTVGFFFYEPVKFYGPVSHVTPIVDINIVQNYPSLEAADGTEPQWWDVVGGTLTEEDATGESLSAAPNERVLKMVTNSTTNRIAQAWPISWNRMLNTSSKVSTGAWVYVVTAGTLTYRVRENGVGTIDEVTTTTTGSWVWLELDDLDVGSGGNLQLWILHSATAATFYVANPTMNVGSSVIPWKRRGLVFKHADNNFYTATDPGGDPAGWTAQDLTSITSDHAVKALLTIEYYNSTNANTYIRTRPTGLTVGAAHNVIRGAGDANYNTNTFEQLLDDSQSFDFYSSAAAGDTESLIMSCRGFWEWE